jgi:hypothetical protein
LKGLKTLAINIFDRSLDEFRGTEHERLKTRIKNSNLQSTWLSIADNLLVMWESIEQHHDFSEEDILHLHKNATRSCNNGKSCMVTHT